MNEYGNPSPRGSIANTLEDPNRPNVSPQNYYSDPPSGNYLDERAAIRYGKHNDRRLSVCVEEPTGGSDMYSDDYTSNERRGSYNDLGMSRNNCYDNPSMSQEIVWSEQGRSEDYDGPGRAQRSDYPYQGRYDNRAYASTPNNGGMRRYSYYSREPRKLSSYVNDPSSINNDTDDSIIDPRYTRRRSECPPTRKVSNERRKSAYFTGMYRFC